MATSSWYGFDDKTSPQCKQWSIMQVSCLPSNSNGSIAEVACRTGHETLIGWVVPFVSLFKKTDRPWFHGHPAWMETAPHIPCFCFCGHKFHTPVKIITIIIIITTTITTTTTFVLVLNLLIGLKKEVFQHLFLVKVKRVFHTTSVSSFRYAAHFKALLLSFQSSSRKLYCSNVTGFGIGFTSTAYTPSGTPRWTG